MFNVTSSMNHVGMTAAARAEATFSCAHSALLLTLDAIIMASIIILGLLSIAILIPFPV